MQKMCLWGGPIGRFTSTATAGFPPPLAEPWPWACENARRPAPTPTDYIAILYSMRCLSPGETLDGRPQKNTVCTPVAGTCDYSTDSR